jgi:formamidopyrimidine-DNA glycosylase
MPELPEVETIRRALEPAVVGAHISGILLPDPSIAGPEGEEGLRVALGRTIRAVLRRGKHLILLLERNSGVVLHLRMTGALLLDEPVPQDRVRAVLQFSNGAKLTFVDMRRLGTIRYYEDLKPLLLRLGSEPLDIDVTWESLGAELSRRHIPVKAALLDQHILAGIGNMYADEALHRARIHPTTPADQVGQGQVRRLWQAIRDVLEEAIANQGASINTYRLPDGERGTAHTTFSVAHRKGAPCPKCGTPIERVMVRKRGAYYCPECQPAVREDGSL